MGGGRPGGGRRRRRRRRRRREDEERFATSEEGCTIKQERISEQFEVKELFSPMKCIGRRRGFAKRTTLVRPAAEPRCAL